MGQGRIRFNEPPYSPYGGSLYGETLSDGITIGDSLLSRLNGVDDELFPNRPTSGGWTTMWDREMPALSEVATFGTLGSMPNAPLVMYNDNTSRVTELSNAHPGYFDKAIRITHPQGVTGGAAAQGLFGNPNNTGHQISWDKEDYPVGNDIYLGIWVRFPTIGGNPYYLANLGGQKLLYIESREAVFDLPGYTPNLKMPHIIIRKGGTFTGGGVPAFEPQFSNANYNNAYWGDGPDYLGGDPNWHLLEYICIGNTRWAGAETNFLSDGQLKIWGDNILKRNTATEYFYLGNYHNHVMNLFSLLPVYGGGTNPPPYDIAVDYGRMLLMAR